MTGYTAYVLNDAAREKLLQLFLPKYADVVAHHITHQYGAMAADVPAQPKRVNVVGYHDSGAIQVLAVEVDGERYQASREDGAKRYYHITLSLDRAQGVSPRNSNDVLQKIVEEKGEDALYNLPRAVPVDVTPRFLLDEDKPKPPAAPAP